MSRSVIIALFFAAGIVAVVVFYAEQPSSSASVTSLGETMTDAATSDPQPEKSTELQECQHYYAHEFPNAPEYGTFEEYPVADNYNGPTAEVDLESHEVAKRFYTHHTSALEDGVNFAGKYVISEWDFTNIGLMFAVIDAQTGEVYPFPYAVDWDYDFRIDSNLIIINPKDTMPTFSPGGDIACDTKWYSDMKSYYYLFEDDEYIFLGPKEDFNLTTSEWLADEAAVLD